MHCTCLLDSAAALGSGDTETLRLNIPSTPGPVLVDYAGCALGDLPRDAHTTKICDDRRCTSLPNGRPGRMVQAMVHDYI